MKTLFSLFGYAVVACVFFFTWFISPRMYFLLAMGAVIYVTCVVMGHLYGGYCRLWNMKFRGWLRKFRPSLPYPFVRQVWGIGQ